MANTSIATALLLILSVGWGVTPARAFTYEEIDPNGPARAWGKAVGDIDGDGRDDLVVGGYDAATPGLYWYRNPGWAKRTISTTERIATDIEVVDLDQDSRPDIVAAGTNSLLRFEYTDGYWTNRTIAERMVLHDIEVRDFDGDGRRDIVGRGQHAAGNVLHFWRQLPMARWSYSTIGLPEEGEGLVARDLNRDGKPDIAIGKYWLKNNSTPGSIVFKRYLYNTAAPTGAYITTGLIDGDDYVDIVVTPAEPAGCRDRVSWFKAPARPATGQWVEHVIEPDVECVVHFVGVADFDQDGNNDVATAMMQQGQDPKIKVYYNTKGDGDFGPPSIVAETSSHSMKIIDVDRDGRKSLFGADWNRSPTTTIELWRQ